MLNRIGQRGGGRRPRRRAPRAPLTAAVLGLAGVVPFLTTATGLSFGLYQLIHDRAEAHFIQTAEAIEKSVTTEIDRYRVALADIAAAVIVLDRVDAAGFADLTDPLTRHRLPGAATVSFVAAAETSQIAAVQARWRELGDPGLRWRPHGEGERFFSVLSRPLDGGPARLGVDATAVPEARDVLQRARSTGQMAMSRADVMLSEFGTSVVTVADWRPDRIDTSLPRREMTVSVPQRTWRLDIRPTVSLLPPTGVGLQATATLLGVGLAILLAVPVTVLWIARERAARDLITATAELRADVHRREKVEEQLRIREVELVGFAGVVAHDLRSPLATVAGYVEVLRDETAGLLTDDHREFLDRLHAGTRRMHSLLEDLLAYATAGSAALRTTDVDANHGGGCRFRFTLPVVNGNGPLDRGPGTEGLSALSGRGLDD